MNENKTNINCLVKISVSTMIILLVLVILVLIVGIVYIRQLYAAIGG